MNLEDTRRIDGATQDDFGRYFVTRNGVPQFGYFTHFSGMWVCYTCGHLCECYDDESEVE